MENTTHETRKPALKITNLLSDAMLKELRARILEAHKTESFATLALNNGAVWAAIEFDVPGIGIKTTRKCGFVVYEPETPFMVTPEEKTKYDMAIQYHMTVQGMEADKAERSARNMIIKLRGNKKA